MVAFHFLRGKKITIHAASKDEHNNISGQITVLHLLNGMGAVVCHPHLRKQLLENGGGSFVL